MNRVNQQQVEDWLESPVTEALKDYALTERDDADKSRGLNAYVVYEPHKTQENMALANAYWTAWSDIIEVLTDGRVLFEEPENE